MRKINAGLFITLDGVVEAPGSSDISLLERRGWTEPFFTEEMGAAIAGQMQNQDALLLGRKTYQEFAAFWPSVPDEDPFGQLMNGTTKYVVSNTLDNVDAWKNSHLIKGNIAEEITKLKQQPGKDIGMTGSGTLVESLLQMGLLDELELLVFPVVLGMGKRLFNDGRDMKTLELVEAKPYSTGVVALTYRPKQNA